MPPAAAERTHTAPIDGATTFDSPFSAVLLAVWDWESLFLPASGQGGRNLMAFQGILCALPLFCGQDCPSCRLKLCPCAVLTARGLFVHCRLTHSRREPGIIARIPVRGMRSAASGGICWRVCQGAIRLSPPSRPAEIDGNGKSAKR